MGNQHGKSQNPYKLRQRRHGSWRGVDTPFPPGKPFLSPDVDSGPDIITIRWDKPFKDGGAPITGYLVEHRRVGSPHWVRATPMLVQNTELTMSGLEPGWRYQFRVFAENVAGLSDSSVLSEPLTVTLQRSAITAPRFTQDLINAVGLENEKVEFVVYYLGHPPPRICWFKDEFEIFSSRRTRILTESDRSVLTIYQSAVCDVGEIKCTATNKAGHASTKCRLTLESPPTVRLPRQYEDGLLFEIGEMMRLKVTVAGLPPPSVYWTHDGEAIREDDRVMIDTVAQSSMLKIDSAQRTDRGEYQIKAVNRLGTDVASFLVTITDKPSPPGRAKVVMTLGKSVTLSWHTPEDDGGCKIGNYIIEYYRLGWNVWLKAATTRQLTTMLGDLIEGSEYKFRVKAESPYGVSEPSEESDVVFIPDSKRGILQPSARSRSQPKEIEEILAAPVASSRKVKPPRSHSSPRTIDEADYEGAESGDKEVSLPQRPERLKSPPKTPDTLSPKVERRAKDLTLNFDRISMAREMSYGSPEIMLPKMEPRLQVEKSIEEIAYQPSKALHDSIRQTMVKSPSPTAKSPSSPIQKRPVPPAVEGKLCPPPIVENPSLPLTVDITPVREEMEPAKPQVDTLSPTNLSRNKFSRENSENLGGSSEYMLVLFPDDHHKPFDDADFEYSKVAPPISLSAPELGTEFPPPDNLRVYASSTELLHERAMVRFYQEALEEEDKLKRKRDGRSPIPKIQINSRQEDDVVMYERKHSLRRRSGGNVPQQILWTQKRHSLRNSGDFSDVAEVKTGQRYLTADDKRQAMSARQRSESEEREEEEFEKVRLRMATVPQSPRRKKISVVAEEAWDEEDDEEEPRLVKKLRSKASKEYADDEIISITESEESSFEDRWGLDTNVPVRQALYEEEDTYHPNMRRVISPLKTPSPPPLPVIDKNEEPFEILSRPTKLPDPNFVPKPILKKRDPDERKSSSSDAENPSPSVVSKIDEFEMIPKSIKDTTAIASISSIAAVGPIIAQPMLKKKSEDEQKVIIEHYGDIVKSYAERKKPSESTMSLLSKYAQQGTDEVEVQLERQVEEKPAVKVETKIEVQEQVWAPIKLEVAPTKPMSKFDQKLRELEMKINATLTTTAPTPTTSSTSMVREPRQPRRPSPMRSSWMKTPPVPVSTLPSFMSTRTTNAPTARDAQPQRRSTSKQRTGSRSRSTTRSSKPSSRSNSSTQTPQLTTSVSTATSTLAVPRRPRMCEIMTQTSTCVDPFTPVEVTQLEVSTHQTAELTAIATETVRTTVDYITDLAMFALAGWLVIFSNELLAIPVLGVLVFRQLTDEIKRRMPKRWVPLWVIKIRKRFSRKKTRDEDSDALL